MRGEEYDDDGGHEDDEDPEVGVLHFEELLGSSLDFLRYVLELSRDVFAQSCVLNIN